MRIPRAYIVALVAFAAANAEETRISILATTDLHGNLLPYDYFTARPADRGLAKIASLIQEARSQNPNHLLIDCGDTIQGTPLESVYQQYAATGRLPLNLAFAGRPLERDPMMLAMNDIGYDVMVVGNHEFNFGLKNLAKARSTADFPWISANILTDPGAEAASGIQPFAPYFLKTVAGVKIAIVGITTPSIPDWESEEHYHGYRFEDGVEAARRVVNEVRAREHPDVLIVAAHSGLDRDPKTPTAATGDAREDMIYQIATEVKGIDAIIFGHTHQQRAALQLGDVLLMQPKNWGMSLGRMEFVLDRDSSGTWKIVSKSSGVIPVTAATPADAKVMEIARPYHEIVERYLNTQIADAPVSLETRFARVKDTALLDAIQQVQLFYSKADVSFASSFNSHVVIPKGPVTVRQIAALYVYENELYAIEGTGKMVREALENAARYFQACSGDCAQGPLINRRVIGYNYDMAQGIEYEIDLNRPVGDRIRNLRWHGQPLQDSQPLRIAINNYRSGGSAGYTTFRGAKVVWRSREEIRDMVIRYYIEHKELPAMPDDNWRIVPDAARKTLEREAAVE